MGQDEKEGGLSLESHHDELGNMGSVSSSSGGRLFVHGMFRPLRCFCILCAEGTDFLSIQRS